MIVEWCVSNIWYSCIRTYIRSHTVMYALNLQEHCIMRTHIANLSNFPSESVQISEQIGAVGLNGVHCVLSPQPLFTFSHN